MDYDTILAAVMAANIKCIRIRKGYTQEDLAKKAGIPQKTLAYIEQHQCITSTANAKRIADALDVAVDDLICDNKRIEEAIKQILNLDGRVLLILGKYKPKPEDKLKLNVEAAEIEDLTRKLNDKKLPVFSKREWRTLFFYKPYVAKILCNYLNNMYR